VFLDLVFGFEKGFVNPKEDHCREDAEYNDFLPHNSIFKIGVDR
jgi:hypothetical protein